MLGVNTARSLTFKDGRVNRGAGGGRSGTQLRRPVDPNVDARGRDPSPVRRAGRSMTTTTWWAARRWRWQAFAECGVDLLLAGHLHAEPRRQYGRRATSIGDYAALVVQAGTATSTREQRRGQFLQRRSAWRRRDKVEVDRYGWDSRGHGAFSAASVPRTFLRSGNVWAAQQ